VAAVALDAILGISYDHDLFPHNHIRSIIFQGNDLFSGSLYFANMASSHISMVSLLSPVMETTWQPGSAVFYT
jgi:uncharacterized membrane protein YgdD (TMEM256/DUF423 family)